MLSRPSILWQMLIFITVDKAAGSSFVIGLRKVLRFSEIEVEFRILIIW
jgi:hypothetical protein